MTTRNKIVVAVAATAVLIAVFWPRTNFLLDTIDSVVLNIVAVSGISSRLARGLVILVSIPFFWAVAEYTKKWHGFGKLTPSLKLYTDKHGIIIVGYVAAYFLVLFGLSRESFSQKWCADTREGIRVFDDPGSDPMYGIALARCTPEQILVLRRTYIGVPQRLSQADVSTLEFFDPATGRPKVWFAKGSDGEYELFDSPGTHPQTQEALKPADAAAVREIKALAIRRHTDDQRRVRDQAMKQEAVEGQRRANAAAEAARERDTIAREAEEAFVKTFVNDTTGGRSVGAVLAVSQDGRVDDHATQILADAIGGSPEFFKPAFVARGLFAEVVNGDSTISRRLGLTSSRAPVVLAALSSETETNQVVGESVTKVTTTARVRVLRDARSTSFTVVGIGTAVGESQARRQANDAALAKALLRVKAF